ncbi:MAG: NusG domain II-containing protein [Oscillospiraceae bacterium]|nr:NusG domain II-containing protein [Oscillospiraceae bacterium]
MKYSKQTYFVIAAAIVTALVAALLLQFLLIRVFGANGTVATVYRDGIVLDTIDLDRVEEPYNITILRDDGGENVILVEPGQISVYAATCRDQICVNQGPISDGTRPIVCLPHRIVIQIGSGSDDVADALGG